MNETLKILKDRKSVRKYTDQKITEEEKEAILSAAMRSPTAGNMMLYSIIDVTDQKIKDALCATCGNQKMISEAPMLLVFTADYRRWMKKFHRELDGKEKVLHPEEGNMFLSICDTMIAAQTAVIAAESMGIGSCYIGNFMEHFEEQREILSLPPHVIPITLLCFGYPTGDQKRRKQRSRFPREMVVFQNSYHDLTDEELEKYAEDVNIEAFYHRKHSSDFQQEMNRSVREMIKSWPKE